MLIVHVYNVSLPVFKNAFLIQYFNYYCFLLDPRALFFYMFYLPFVFPCWPNGFWINNN